MPEDALAGQTGLRQPLAEDDDPPLPPGVVDESALSTAWTAPWW